MARSDKNAIACNPDPEYAFDGVHVFRVLEPDASALRKIMTHLVHGTSNKNPRYPGPNPVSLDRACFPALSKDTYHICEKTDGTRATLVACSHKGHDVMAVMDRSLSTHLVPMRHVPTAMFRGTVLDGEIAYNSQTQTYWYLIFDAIIVSGVRVSHLPFSERMVAVNRALRPYAGDPSDAFTLGVKYMVQSLKNLPDVPFATDGYVLTPESPPIVHGRHFQMFKLKPAGKHSVDFSYDGHGGLRIWDSSSNAYYRIAELDAQDDEKYEKDEILECIRLDSGKWQCIHVRVDKKTSNDVLTYEKTCLNIEENITLDELTPYFP